MVKATFPSPVGFIGHAQLSQVCSNALICMGAHGADVCVTVTSTSKRRGQPMNSSVQRLATAWPRQLSISYDMKAAWQVLD